MVACKNGSDKGGSAQQQRRILCHTGDTEIFHANHANS